jgi:hypothetical protein
MVRLAHGSSGLPIGPPLEHRGIVHALIVSQDGRRMATACSDNLARCWKTPVPFGGGADQLACWVRVLTGLDFDAGDAIRPLDELTRWELRRRLLERGGPAV